MERIAERAAQTGEPVMTVDAGVDERFGTAASVATMRLRSVLAVPLRQRGTIIGCIYVDHRLRGGAFDDGAATVLGGLADIAAIAIENARLTQELRSTTKAVDDLNGRLSAELADRDAELVRVRAELPARERLRGAYDAIVGRSPWTRRATTPSQTWIGVRSARSARFVIWPSCGSRLRTWARRAVRAAYFVDGGSLA
jgi:transcriptional regulator with GAF, ATPase, and Fis domain